MISVRFSLNLKGSYKNSLKKQWRPAEILVYENEIKKQTELKNNNIADVMNAEKKMAGPWKNGLVICEGTRIK